MKIISTVPNLISAIRLILAPVVLVLLIRNEHRIALIVFFAAGISDLLDGYIARKYNIQSKLGLFLDPIADKLLIFLCVIYFVIIQSAPWWWLCILILRDISLLLGMLVLKSKSVQIEIHPTFIGKSSTAINMFALLFLMASSFKPILAGPLIQPLIVLAAAVTFGSFLEYSGRWISILKNRSGE